MHIAGLRIATMGAILMLAACAGGTPECASGDVKDNLKSIADERLARLVSNEAALPGLADAIRKRVSYEFTSIRTVEHDESVDTYQCSSTLHVALDEGKSGQWELGFDYGVYSVEGGDSEFEVEYDPVGLVVLGEAAGKINQELTQEFNREQDVTRLSRQLQEARDGGAAWSVYEKQIVDELRSKNGDVPEVTSQQRAKSIEERVRLEDPMQGFVNPPEDVLAEIRRLRPEGAGAPVNVDASQEDQADDEPNGDVVVDE